jgi:hypothetical protein
MHRRALVPHQHFAHSPVMVVDKSLVVKLSSGPGVAAFLSSWSLGDLTAGLVWWPGGSPASGAIGREQGQDGAAGEFSVAKLYEGMASRLNTSPMQPDLLLTSFDR